MYYMCVVVLSTQLLILVQITHVAIVEHANRWMLVDIGVRAQFFTLDDIARIVRAIALLITLLASD